MTRSARVHAAVATIVAALALPAVATAAPPANDNRAAPAQISLPAQVSGTTAESTLEREEPFPICGSVKSSVWYEFETGSTDRVAIRLDAGGDLDALVDVFQRRRSQLTPVGCDQTDRDGDGAITFRPAKGATYLIRVGARPGSVEGPFRLDVFLPQPAARPPGPQLPAGGVTRTVDPIQNTADAFSLRMRAGRSYRINLSPSPVQSRGNDDEDEDEEREGCVGLRIYPPGTRDFDDTSPVRTLRCGGYVLFTPRSGEGGRYPMQVVPGLSRGEQRYHLEAAGASTDDTAPGLYLSNQERARGALAGRGVDVVDLYRFDVNRRSDLELTLSSRADFRMIVLNDRGRRVGSGDSEEPISRQIRPGRYFIAVRADGRATGSYRLTRISRTITRASISWGGKGRQQISPGGTSRAVLAVSPGVDGPSVLTIQRFDPLAGWLFFRTVRPRVVNGRAVVPFTPPSEGRWRVTGRFLGTRTAARSETGFATLLVAPPLRP